MRIRTQLLAVSVLVTGLATPAVAQSGRDFWEHKWFWGAQAGAYVFSVDNSTQVWGTAGGHWFITAGRSALQLSFDYNFGDTVTRTYANGLMAEFNDMERYQAVLYALPSFANLNVMLGGGFAIQNVSSATPVGTFTSPGELTAAQDQIDATTTKAFFVLDGGVQWRFARKWVAFGNYQFTRGTESFIITSTQHTVTAGIRFALVGAKEEVTTGAR